MPDDHSKLVPLLPIPNRTVKRLCADDSAGSRVKVGHRQAIIEAVKTPKYLVLGGFVLSEPIPGLSGGNKPCADSAVDDQVTVLAQGVAALKFGQQSGEPCFTGFPALKRHCLPEIGGCQRPSQQSLPLNRLPIKQPELDQHLLRMPKVLGWCFPKSRQTRAGAIKRAGGTLKHGSMARYQHDGVQCLY